MSKEGSLVEVPPHIFTEGVESVAEYLKPRLEAAAGGSLEAYTT